MAIENAALSFKNKQLETQLDHSRHKNRRKKVQVNPGELFANIESIKLAQDSLKELEANEEVRATNYIRTHTELELELASKEIQDTEFQNMQFVFGLDN
jgi:hypothetical protein